MSNPDVRELLTSGQVAAVLHKSAGTIGRWVRNGELAAAAKVAGGNGLYLFDPEVVKEKAMELALGPHRVETLDLGINESDGPERRRAS